MSKEEKKLRVESEHALFVAKCIYEAAERRAVTFPTPNHRYVALQDLEKICSLPPETTPSISAVQLVEKLKEICRKHSALYGTYGNEITANALMLLAEDLLPQTQEKV